MGQQIVIGGLIGRLFYDVHKKDEGRVWQERERKDEG